MPFMILEIITRIANENSVREENGKIYDRLRHGKKFYPLAINDESLLFGTQKILKSIQDFAELF